MSRCIALIMVVADLVVVPAVVAQTPRPSTPIAVFVSAATTALPGKPTEAERVEHSASFKATQARRKDLDKTLKAQFGNKRDRWPAEALERYLDAEGEVARLNADWEYRLANPSAETLLERAAELTTVLQGGAVTGTLGTTEKAAAGATTRDQRINDAGEDLGIALLGAGIGTKTPRRMNNIAIVKTYGEAQLVIEVVACRTNGLDDTNVANDAEFVSVAIKRGPRLSADRFAAVPRTYVHRDAMRLAAPSEDAPWWRFQAYGQFVRSATLRVLTMLVEDFASKLPGVENSKQ